MTQRIPTKRLEKAAPIEHAPAVETPIEPPEKEGHTEVISPVSI
jgi:hypothetical protein